MNKSKIIQDFLKRINFRDVKNKRFFVDVDRRSAANNIFNTKINNKRFFMNSSPKMNHFFLRKKEYKGLNTYKNLIFSKKNYTIHHNNRERKDQNRELEIKRDNKTKIFGEVCEGLSFGIFTSMLFPPWNLAGLIAGFPGSGFFVFMNIVSCIFFRMVTNNYQDIFTAAFFTHIAFIMFMMH